MLRMGCIGKGCALVLILIVAVSSLSLMIIKPINAQTSKPSVPEFTLKLIDYSADAKAIELAIKNQPFASYIDNGQIISLYYNVHFKLHDSDSWTAMYYCGDIFTTHSSSEYTKLDYPLPMTSPNGSSCYLLRENAGNYFIMSQIPFNEQIDFRVQAMEGYLTSASFTGQTSDWNIQTITIPGASTSPNPSPTPSPEPTTKPESFPATLAFVASLGIALAVIGLVIYSKKRR